MKDGDDRLDEARDQAEDADRALGDAARKVAFADEIAAVTERQAGLGTLAGEIARARSRGWVWGADWEAAIEELRGQAGHVATDVRKESSDAKRRLSDRIDRCRADLTRTPVDERRLDRLSAIAQEAASVLDAVEAEEARLRALAKPLVERFDGLQREVKEAHVHLDRFEEAKFDMPAGEHPWLTAEATWKDAPGGEVNGLLYLSDRRIRFEQKETVATKKFLFFTTASEERHACLVDEPVGNIARSDDSTAGLVFKDQLVTIGWQNTRHEKSTFDINSGGTAKEWDTRIEELRSGRIAHRMAPGIEAPTTLGMPIDPPTACSACNAALDAPIRGLTTLTCKYCGQRHDLRFG